MKYDCNQCDSSYSSHGYLTMHKQSMGDCDQCDGAFKDEHNHAKHEGVKYDCYQCDGSFTLQGMLINLKESKHEQVKYVFILY